ncbi:MAG TPA: hypothetical protein DEQ20_02205 [Desulfobulbaceae bacterium]|nr:MAG: hypothetical protein A2520_03700 [Deltaproteobacteria bacterium RIFOXYD12_FULL_53_23]HCC53731.1 hypothetical protein [Desulfobulbaceae bacterium]
MFKKNLVKSPLVTRKGFLVLLLFLAFAPGIAMAAEPVAMVTDVKGAVRLKLNQQTKPLAVLTYLAPDAEIELDKGAHVVMTYFSQATEYTFKGPARIAIQVDSAKAITGTGELRKLDNEKSATVKKFIQTARVTQATMAMRSLPTIKPNLQSPLNSKISSSNPTFRWKAIEDTAKYQLILTDNLGAVVYDTSVETNSWQIPGASTLKRGIPYAWKVTAMMKSGENYSSNQSNFTIAHEDEIKNIEARRPAADASFSDRVVYAVYLETEGFYEAALGRWQELSKERPDDANLRKRGKQ